MEYFYIWEAVENKTVGPQPVKLSQLGEGGSRKAVISSFLL